MHTCDWLLASPGSEGPGQQGSSGSEVSKFGQARIGHSPKGPSYQSAGPGGLGQGEEASARALKGLSETMDRSVCA